MMDVYAVVSVRLLLLTAALMFALQVIVQCVVLRRGLGGFRQAIHDATTQYAGAVLLFAMGYTFWRVI